MTAVVSPETEKAAEEAAVPKLAAVVAEFPSATAVTEAARKIRATGLVDWDVHSPFPIHGIDDVIGIRPTRLPWITLCAGATGIATALTMQYWMNAVDYAFWISGKPFFGLPAAVPVSFELMVLFAAISTLVSMLLLNGLPRFSNPLFNSERFLRATNDRFFIVVSAKDPSFNRDTVIQALTDCQATGIDECFAPTPAELKWPAVIPSLIVTASVVLLVPALLIALKRSTTTTEPRLQVIQDMDFQAKFKPQRPSTLFADGRAMRPQAAGTVARGDLQADTRLYKGLDSSPQASGATAQVTTPSLEQVTRLVSLHSAGLEIPVKQVAQDAAAQPAPPADGQPAGQPPAQPDPLEGYPWVKSFPIEVTDKTMKRGQERYNIYCSTCHGLAGDGDGLITQRAMELQEGTWIKPTTFHSDPLRAQPVGRLFHTVSHGARKMPGYGDLIPVEDRWAIVLYVKALQQARNASVKEVPSSLVPQLHDLPKE